MKKHFAQAIWKGTLQEGTGYLTTNSKVLNNHEYCFKSRFGDGKATNPDELLAASHAGCFAMALSLMLGKEGFTANTLDVNATITMDADKLALTGSHLVLKASIPNISQEQFLTIAINAKENCPISKALSIPISLDASLV
jgi:osmotically inducible protein OsmC